MGAEGPGLREKTAETCDALVRIDAAGGFGSLNVSNAAAVALYAARGSK
jgi:23S rRNA (guanosine2251-2'-O)-methyltransferase